MIVKLLTEHYLEFLTLKGGRTGSSESTLVKMPHFWKSNVQVGITRNSAASLCHGSPRLCNEYLLFRFPNLS